MRWTVCGALTMIWHVAHIPRPAARARAPRAGRRHGPLYVLSIEETLFGDTALVREWGRIGTAGRRRLDLFERRAQASEALELWLGRKVRRGYRPSTVS